jgi:hypothetical protein
MSTMTTPQVLRCRKTTEVSNLPALNEGPEKDNHSLGEAFVYAAGQVIDPEGFFGTIDSALFQSPFYADALRRSS